MARSGLGIIPTAEFESACKRSAEGALQLGASIKRVLASNRAFSAGALTTCFALNAYDARGYIFPPPQRLMPITKAAGHQSAACCGRGSPCISKRRLREQATSLWQTSR
ncbi:MAG: hypothetical protein DMF05_12755 [Verrucomicrobia bacterium]|nr:MAG: hypothetical protein DMF05_12755 [Verrucomicrobiota bacterium]